MTRIFATLVLAALVSAACRGTSTPPTPLNEIVKTRSGNLEVVLLSAETAVKTGKDAVTIEFRAVSDGRLIDVGMVKANATMLMAGMAPMFGPVDVERSAVPGRYLASTELSMAGERRVSLERHGAEGHRAVVSTPPGH